MGLQEMTKKINNFEIDVAELPANLPGVRFIRQIKNMNNDANDADSLQFTSGYTMEVSPNNYFLMESLAKKYTNKGIVEIGVNRNGAGSFTWALLNNKPKSTIYLGVDIDDKSSINNKDNNVYTIRANSFDQDKIRNYMKEIGLIEISLLFIDGWHSVNAVINDWKYSDLLSDDGIIVFHDTNFHPGPAIFLDAIDNTIYKVEKYFTDQPGDCGMGVAYRL